MSKFHLRLRELRNSRKLSQQELADLLRISKSSINMYERGEREPSLDTQEAIADFFNVDMDYLMGRTSEIKTFDKIYNTDRLSKESKAYDIIQKTFGKHAAELIHLFSSFNEEGKEKLLDTAADMSQLDRYKKCAENNDVRYVMQAARDGGPLGVVETTPEEETKLTNTPLLNFDL